MSNPKIDQQYTTLCTQEGDLTSKIRGLERQREVVRARIDALSQAADELNALSQQEALQTAEDQAAKAFSRGPIVNPLPPEETTPSGATFEQQHQR